MQELKFSNFRILYLFIAGFSKFKFLLNSEMRSEVSENKRPQQPNPHPETTG